MVLLLSSYPPLCLRVVNSSCLSVSPPSLHVHYRHFNATTGQSATEEDFGTFLPCSSLSAFPWHSDFCFPRSTNEPVLLSCHLYAACRNAIDRLLKRPSLISLAVTAISYMEGSQPFIYRCVPRGTRTGQCPAEKPRLARSLRKMGRTLTCPLYRLSSYLSKC